MVERIDALAQADTAQDADLDARRQEAGSSAADPRGLGCIMYRAAMLRPKRRPAAPSPSRPAPEPVLGGVYLPPSLRRALAALLRGDHVSAAEKAALARAVSLLSSQPLGEETAPEESSQDAADPWAAIQRPANSNLSLAMRVERRQLASLPAEQRYVTENPILHRLGCASRPAEED